VSEAELVTRQHGRRGATIIRDGKGFFQFFEEESLITPEVVNARARQFTSGSAHFKFVSTIALPFLVRFDQIWNVESLYLKENKFFQ